jgi:hypothetical protein
MIDNNDDTVRRSGGTERPSRLMDLADNRGGTDPDLKRVGALLGKVAPPAGLTAVQLLRVRERLDQSTRPAVAQGRRARFSILVLTGLSVLLASGVVAASRGWMTWPRLTALLPEALVAQDQQMKAQAPRPPSSSPSRSAPNTESALLERAVVALRQMRDPVKALSLLDEYDAQFADGLLTQEAARLRIDALLLAQQTGNALERLNALSLSEGARDLELRLIRGELRAAANDCSRGLVDFDAVLSQSADASLRRRAIAGRTGCRAGAAAASGEAAPKLR